MVSDAPRAVRLRAARPLRTALSVLVIAATVVVGVGLKTPAAHASPTPNPSDQSVSALESQINKQWNSLEPTIESFDAVSAKLAAQQGYDVAINYVGRPEGAEETALIPVGIAQHDRER